MQELFSLFDSSNFIPHGFCINWTPNLLRLYVLSDLFIALAYFSIPVGLAYFIWRRKDLKYSWMFKLFGAFILSCGATHLLSIIVIWYPIYWLDASMKAVTASISMVTALMMIWVIPKALKLPSPVQLEKEVQERREAQEQLREANQSLEVKVNERTRDLKRQQSLYAALSETNQFIVRCTSEEELLPQICRIAVEFGGLKMAWIGLTDPDTRIVRPVASFGMGTEFLQDIEVSADDATPFGRGPVGISIRENQPYWCMDFMNNPATAPWHDRGASVGWASSASLPLHRSGVTIGALVLHSGEINFFDEDARNLLVEMAMDISFALDNFTREKVRKQAEEAQSKSEARYRAVARSANDAIITADNVGNIVSWNHSAEIIFGYAEAEILGQPLTLLMPQRYQDRHLTGMNRMLSGGEPHIIGKTVELEGLRKDGSEFPLELSLAQWETAEGRFFTGFIHDITVRKQDEQKTRAITLRYQTLMQTSIDGIHVMDELGNIVEANDAFCRMLGYTQEEVARLNVADWDAQWSVEELRTKFREIEGKSNLIGTVHRRKDGVLIEVEISVSGVELEGRNYVFASSRDITERKQAEQELRIAATAFEAQEGIVVTDARNVILRVNQAFSRLTGYSAEEAIGQTPAMLKSGRQDSEFYRQMWEALTRDHYWQGEIWNRRKDGEVYPERLTITAVTNAEGQVTNYIGSFSDITERKQAERELRIAAIAFETQEGIFITDAHNIILRVNQAFSRLTGYSAEELIGQKPDILKSGRHDKQFYRDMWEALNRDRYWQGEIWNRYKNDEVHPGWLTITAVTNTQGQVTNYIGTYHDITQSKEADDKIHSLAFYDPLTNLPNRRLLHDRLQHTLTTSTRHHNHGAVVFIDLDDFKRLNDTKGHNIGDLLLIEVANRLQACVREGDTVARLGGDEFVVILEDLNEEPAQAAAQTEAVCDKILPSIRLPYLLQGYAYYCSASIGISLFCGQEITVEELLKRADTAMYQAKSAGRNTLRFYDPAMQTALEVRTALENDLRAALEEDQFKLYYQMQADHSGLIHGAEVLLRWQHPERGLVSPLEFIPLAEETGLILPIGQWVLETACAQLKDWEADPLTRNLQLAVNVSARQFHQADYVEQVRQTLHNHALDASRLKLELTESLVLDNIDDTIAKMQALREVGVRFSMDDFGTGYSSLSYLTQLPLDQLKIDQSFVRNIGVKSTDAVIVQTIIGMASNLGMEVIAEGVETEEQRVFLEQHGCLLCQGYLFGRPVLVEEFEKLLTKA